MAVREAAAGRRTSDYDYALPRGLIAQRPAPRRDASRLLVVSRGEEGRVDARFPDLLQWMQPGDVLVLNDTRVFPARLVGRKPTGARVEVLLLRPLSDRYHWTGWVRPGGKLKPGRRVVVSDALAVDVLESEDGMRTLRLVTELDPDEAIARFGRIPLPPYVEREDDAQDRERYQTVYARRDGSVAAPTAGLHFTPALLEALAANGVRQATLTLHVGPGTFRPVETQDPARHRLHAEWYEVPDATAAAIAAARASGGRVCAVGTTVARVLETVSSEDGRLRAGSGWTDLFLRPPYRFRVVDRLLTNFHLPRSTLLMLVAAFAGYERTMRAYAHAVEHEYRFYSYGDAMLVL
jgi:S-adenosylmethionine:tRNA ribosyltransferase-isomerase